MPYATVSYTVHAAERLVERGLRRQGVEYVLQTGERIEDYPDDPRGASYLMLSWYEERPLHVVAADDETAKRRSSSPCTGPPRKNGATTSEQGSKSSA
jgi:hypothetical protein